MAGWTDEAKTVIKDAFLKDNLSYSQIEAKYSGKLDSGRKLTRSAVAGILNRASISGDSAGRQDLAKVAKIRSETRSRMRAEVRTAPRAQPLATRAPALRAATVTTALTPPPPVRRPGGEVTLPPSYSILFDAMGTNRCMFETSLPNDGLSRYCGHTCDRLPMARSGRTHYSFCTGHRMICEAKTSPSEKKRRAGFDTWLIRLAS